jgi:hypothetical protein
MNPATPVISHFLGSEQSAVLSLLYAATDIDHKEREEHKKEKNKSSLYYLSSFVLLRSLWLSFSISDAYSSAKSRAAFSSENRSATSRCNFHRSSMPNLGLCAKFAIAPANSSIYHRFTNSP